MSIDPDPPRRDRGLTITEFLVVASLIVAVLAVSLPALGRFYKRHQLASAAEMVQTHVQRARMSALKEKRSYRVVVHDENDLAPNRIELQRLEGGSFVSVAGESHPVPAAVRILGTSPTKSVDNVTVSRRGECTSGAVFVAAAEEDLRVVTIAPTCFAETQ